MSLRAGEALEGKIEDIEDYIERCNRRRGGAFQQFSCCRMKLKALAECWKESYSQLETAQEQLAAIVRETEQSQ